MQIGLLISFTLVLQRQYATLQYIHCSDCVTIPKFKDLFMSSPKPKTISQGCFCNPVTSKFREQNSSY